MKNLSDFTIDQLETLLDECIAPCLEINQHVVETLNKEFAASRDHLAKSPSYRRRLAHLDNLKAWDEAVRLTLREKHKDVVSTTL